MRLNRNKHSVYTVNTAPDTWRAGTQALAGADEAVVYTMLCDELFHKKRTTMILRLLKRYCALKNKRCQREIMDLVNKSDKEIITWLDNNS